MNSLKPIRYLLLLMGFFSPNAKSLKVLDNDCVYPAGVDPAWYMAKNELAYLNSLKMKIAVILGVLQMSLGVILKGYNYKFSHKRLEFYFEFIPQILLLLSLFGFMDLMIILKWTTDFT